MSIDFDSISVRGRVEDLSLLLSEFVLLPTGHTNTVGVRDPRLKDKWYLFLSNQPINILLAFETKEGRDGVRAGLIDHLRQRHPGTESAVGESNAVTRKSPPISSRFLIEGLISLRVTDCFAYLYGAKAPWNSVESQFGEFASRGGFDGNLIDVGLQVSTGTFVTFLASETSGPRGTNKYKPLTHPFPFPVIGAPGSVDMHCLHPFLAEMVRTKLYNLCIHCLKSTPHFNNPPTSLESLRTQIDILQSVLHKLENNSSFWGYRVEWTFKFKTLDEILRLAEYPDYFKPLEFATENINGDEMLSPIGVLDARFSWNELPVQYFISSREEFVEEFKAGLSELRLLASLISEASRSSNFRLDSGLVQTYFYSALSRMGFMNVGQSMKTDKRTFIYYDGDTSKDAFKYSPMTAEQFIELSRDEKRLAHSRHMRLLRDRFAKSHLNIFEIFSGESERSEILARCSFEEVIENGVVVGQTVCAYGTDAAGRRKPDMLTVHGQLVVLMANVPLPPASDPQAVQDYRSRMAAELQGFFTYLPAWRQRVKYNDSLPFQAMDGDKVSAQPLARMLPLTASTSLSKTFCLAAGFAVDGHLIETLVRYFALCDRTADWMVNFAGRQATVSDGWRDFERNIPRGPQRQEMLKEFADCILTQPVDELEAAQACVDVFRISLRLLTWTSRDLTQIRFLQPAVSAQNVPVIDIVLNSPDQYAIVGKYVAWRRGVVSAHKSVAFHKISGSKAYEVVAQELAVPPQTLLNNVFRSAGLNNISLKLNNGEDAEGYWLSTTRNGDSGADEVAKLILSQIPADKILVCLASVRRVAIRVFSAGQQQLGMRNDVFRTYTPPSSMGVAMRCISVFESGRSAMLLANPVNQIVVIPSGHQDAEMNVAPSFDLQKARSIFHILFELFPDQFSSVCEVVQEFRELVPVCLVNSNDEFKRHVASSSNPRLDKEVHRCFCRMFDGVSFEIWTRGRQGVGVEFSRCLFASPRSDDRVFKITLFEHVGLSQRERSAGLAAGSLEALYSLEQL